MSIEDAATPIAPLHPDNTGPATDDVLVAPPRQCGRCRAMFPGDDQYPQGPTDWWLCPPCRLVLLGDGPGRFAGSPVVAT